MRVRAYLDGPKTFRNSPKAIVLHTFGVQALGSMVQLYIPEPCILMQAHRRTGRPTYDLLSVIGVPRDH